MSRTLRPHVRDLCISCFFIALFFGFSNQAFAQNLTASGASHAPVNGSWTAGAAVDGKTSYTNGSLTTRWNAFETAWVVIDTGGLPELFSAYYYSFDDTVTPVGATFSTFGAFGPSYPTFAAAAGPTVSLSVDNPTISETGGVATVTATISATVGSDVTVNLGFTGTAAAGDRTTSASSITITSGQTTGTMTISANADATDEADETVIVDITSVTGASENGVQQVTTTIDDDDGPQVTLSGNAALTTGAFKSMVENGGTGTVTVNIPAPSPQDVVVTLAYSGNSTNGVDYNASASTSVTIPAGNTSANTAVGITATDDGASEGTELIFVDITAVVDGSESGTQQIAFGVLDDDFSPTVALTRDVASIAEAGGVATFTASLSDYSANTVTVGLGVGPGETATLGVDYAVGGHPVSIAPGSVSGAMTITATQDTVDEDDELVVVEIRTVTNGTESGTQQQSTTITDDDAPPNVTLSIDKANISEAAETATVTATLAQASERAVTVDLGFTGTAMHPADYARSGVQIAIAAGNTTGTVNVTPVQDTTDEPDETVIVDITGTTNATEATAQQVTTTITDDDAPPTAILSLSSPTINEDGQDTSTLTATLSEASGKDVVVKLKPVGGTASFASQANDFFFDPTDAGNANFKFDLGTLGMSFEIPKGETTGTVKMSAFEDNIYEGTANETAIFEVDGPGSTDVTAGAPASASLDIIDNDDPPTVTISTSAAEVAEKGGLVRVGAKLSHPTFEDVTVPISRDDAVGTASTDDFGQPATQVVIDAGETESQMTVYGIDDNLYEGPEAILYGVLSATGGGATVPTPSLAAITITDDETPPAVTLATSATEIAEKDGSVTLTITLAEAMERDATVKLAFTGTATGQLAAAGKSTSNSHDFTWSTDAVSIKAGETEGTVTLTSVDDTDGEFPAETIIVDVDLDGSNHVAEPQAQQVTITMIDDDNRIPVATTDNFEMDEDKTAIFDVLANDTDEDTSSLIITGVDQTEEFETYGGTFKQFTNIRIIDGKKIEVTALPDYAGPANFQYWIKDDQGAESEVGLVFVDIKPVNDPPVAEEMTATVKGGQSATLDPIGAGRVTDATDSPSLARWGELVDASATGASVMHNVAVTGIANAAEIVDGFQFRLPGQNPMYTAGGSVTMNTDNTFTYTARTLFEGTDSFYYWAADDGGGGFLYSAAKVTVTVQKADGLTDIAAGSNAGRSVLIQPQQGQTVSQVVASETNPDPKGELPKGATPELGFLSFNVNQVGSDGKSVVSIQLPEGVKVDEYFKFGEYYIPPEQPAKATRVCCDSAYPFVDLVYPSFFGIWVENRREPRGPRDQKLRLPNAIYAITSNAVYQIGLDENPTPKAIGDKAFAGLSAITSTDASAEGQVGWPGGGDPNFDYNTSVLTVAETLGAEQSLTTIDGNGRVFKKSPGGKRIIDPATGTFRDAPNNLLTAAIGVPGAGFGRVTEVDGSHFLDFGSLRVYERVRENRSGFVFGHVRSITSLSFVANGGMAVGGGYAYITRPRDHRIVRIDLSTGQETVFAGSTNGFKDGPASEATFSSPTDIVYASGDLYVTDQGNNAIRKIDESGNVSTWYKGLKSPSRLSNRSGDLAVLASDGIYLVERDSGKELSGWYSFMYRESDQTGAIIHPEVKNDQGIVTTPGRIDLHFRDGARGDHDLVVNGVIEDPGMPVISDNTVPMATADNATVEEDGQVDIDVLSNDSDADGDPLTVTISSPPQAGSVEVLQDGSTRYVPFPDFNGIDQFSYEASDGVGSGSEALVTVSVTAVQDGPLAEDDQTSAPISEWVDIPVLDNDRHPEDLPVHFIRIGSPSRGKAVVLTDQSIRYIPEVDFEGEDSFEYVVADQNGLQNQATVHITVADFSGDDAFTQSSSTLQGQSITVVAAQPEEVEGLIIPPTFLSQGEHGSVEFDNESGVLTYTPQMDFVGQDQFSYGFGSGEEGSPTIDYAVVITVSDVNEPPVFGSGQVIASTGGPVWVGASPASDPAETTDGFRITLAQTASDPEQSEVTYTWELSDSETFESIMLSVDGDSTGFSLTWQDLLNVVPDLIAGSEVTLYQRVTASDPEGLTSTSSPQEIVFIRGAFTSLEDESSIPTQFELAGNYPNPFNPRTTIRFGMPHAADVHLAVYDVSGRLVSTLIDGLQPPGWHEVSFEASDLPSGAYIYRLTTPDGIFSQTMMLLK